MRPREAGRSTLAGAPTGRLPGGVQRTPRVPAPLVAATTALTTAVAVLAARAAHLRFGATDAEVAARLAGDDLLPDAAVVATRAITIRASAAAVWPWLCQLGQGRGGFYTYDALENLVGADIHSADEIHPEWQDVVVGDEVRLAEQVPLTVAVVEPERALVLLGAAPPGAASPVPYDFSWAFTLHPADDGTTRLVVRERYVHRTGWAPLVVEPLAWVSFVMTQRMLRGIRDRAERSAPAA